MTGSKNWSSGDVLNAADVNSILANQVVMVFANSTARDAGFGGSGEPTLAEGMFCYLNDTNEFQVYTGSAWVTIGDPEVVIVDSANARVGVNETAPASSLVVRKDASAGRGGEISIINLASTAVGNEAALNFGLENSTYAGDNGNGQIKAYQNNTNGAGDLIFSTWSGSAFGQRMKINSGGLVHVDGEFTAGTKTFDIPHPTKGGDWRLRHASIEGPRHDLIYRGTVTLAGGTATVDLDTASGMTAGTWEALCRDPWSMAASSGHVVEWSLSGSALTITSDTDDAICSWIVMAQRQDAQVCSVDAPSATDTGSLIPEYERAPEPPPLQRDDA